MFKSHLHQTFAPQNQLTTSRLLLIHQTGPETLSYDTRQAQFVDEERQSTVELSQGEQLEGDRGDG